LNAVRRGFDDQNSNVRIQALRSAESLDANPSALAADFDRLAADPDFKVRRQLALSLSVIGGEETRHASELLRERDGNHPQMQIALSLARLNQARSVERAPQTTPRPLSKSTELKPERGSRANVIAKYAGVDSTKGRLERGHELFRQTCSSCHRFKGEGNEVGPDLGMTADKPTDWLLAAILDPSATIEDRYRAYTIKLTSGAELAGLIVTETSNNVVLRLAGGADTPILRSAIASQQRAERSLMPEGFESVLTPQDMADLIAWMRKR
jgi:putative heme-binding domain-containing protein